MEYRPVWCEGEYAYFRNDSGVLYRRKMDLVTWKYTPWEVVEENEYTN